MDDREQIPDTQTDSHSSEGDRATPTEDEPMAEDTMVVEVQPLTTEQADQPLALSAEVVADTTSDEAIEPVEEASLVSSQAVASDGNGAEVEGMAEEEREEEEEGEIEEMGEEGERADEVRGEEEGEVEEGEGDGGDIMASQSEAEEDEVRGTTETRDEAQGKKDLQVTLYPLISVDVVDITDEEPEEVDVIQVEESDQQDDDIVDVEGEEEEEGFIQVVRTACNI